MINLIVGWKSFGVVGFVFGPLLQGQMRIARLKSGYNSFILGIGMVNEHVEIMGWESFYCVNTTYLVDRCICPALCRSCQMLEKNDLSWALARTGSVLFTRQVAV